MYHNSSVSLLRLPVEIMGQVFRLIQDRERSMVLNRLLHSCRTLYTLAVGMPGLWTYLDSHWKTQWLYVVVGRAQNLPLQMRWSVLDVRSTHFPFQLYLPRTSEVDLHVMKSPALPISDYYCDMIRAILAIKIPTMRKLSVISTMMERKIVLSETFLGGVCTHLTSLDLTGVIIEAAPSFSSLYHLSLTECHAKFSSVYHLLASAPSVRNLSIHDTFMPNLDTDVNCRPHYEVIDLPHLQLLHLSEPVEQTMVFTLSVLPDPSRNLFLAVMDFGSDQVFDSSKEVNRNIISRLHNFWTHRTGLAKLPPLTLSAQGCGDYTDDPEDWTPYLYSISIEHDVGFHEPSRTAMSWKTICLFATPDPLFASVTRLELMLNGDRIGLEANRNRLNVNLLSHLEHVEITEAFASDIVWQRVGEQDLAELGLWTRSYADAGRPLKTLVFEGCNVAMKEFVMKLQTNVVDKVEWL
jgi:hypothetical protein